LGIYQSKELAKPEFVDKIIDSLMKTQEEQSCQSELLTTLLKEKRKTEQTLENVMSAVEHGIINNTTNKRMKELENHIEEIEKQITIEQSKVVVKIQRDEIKKYFEQALKLEPQMLIGYLIKEIVLFDDKMQIQCNTPLKTSPDNN
jgi:oligoendopeptidase F